VDGEGDHEAAGDRDGHGGEEGGGLAVEAELRRVGPGEVVDHHGQPGVEDRQADVEHPLDRRLPAPGGPRDGAADELGQDQTGTTQLVEAQDEGDLAEGEGVGLVAEVDLDRDELGQGEEGGQGEDAADVGEPVAVEAAHRTQEQEQRGAAQDRCEGAHRLAPASVTVAHDHPYRFEGHGC
jgi:hypothetical protein